MSQNSLRYPDSGGMYEDRSILRNAVLFTTAQRAYVAGKILVLPLDELPPEQLAFLAVEAFGQYVVTLEDSIGWLLVFRNWNPGTPDGSLFAQLDQVNVNPTTEEKLRELLESLDPDGYRRLVHMPSSEELADSGWPGADVEKVNIAMEEQLTGHQRLMERRLRKERATVRAYNKSKHMGLGLLGRIDGELQVRLLTSETGYNDPVVGVRLGGAILRCDAGEIRDRAVQTIQMQAVLNDLLRTLLWVRFGEFLEPPEWVSEAYESSEWPASPNA